MAAFHKYDQNAAAFVAQYETLLFEQVHGCLVDLLPEPGATVLDVGAGSGRDAAWFAARGYEVVAVEPSGSMRSAIISCACGQGTDKPLFFMVILTGPTACHKSGH